MASNKLFPKDAQVIMAILKELGINDYEPRVINQLLEFTYRYVTCVLDDAKVYANHAKKKTVDLDDVKLAVQMQLDVVFTTPPSRDVLLDIARSKNNSPLPLVKPHCGIRLPPDRYCLSNCNYRLKNIGPTKAKVKQYYHSGSGGSSMAATTFMAAAGGGGGQALKMANTKAVVQHHPVAAMAIKRAATSLTTVPRTQSISAPKPVFKFSTGGIGVQKIQAKPKMQVSASGVVEISATQQPMQDTGGGDDNGGSNGSLKRKRENEECDAPI